MNIKNTDDTHVIGEQCATYSKQHVIYCKPEQLGDEMFLVFGFFSFVKSDDLLLKLQLFLYII